MTEESQAVLKLEHLKQIAEQTEAALNAWQAADGWDNPEWDEFLRSTNRLIDATKDEG